MLTNDSLLFAQDFRQTRELYNPLNPIVGEGTYFSRFSAGSEWNGSEFIFRDVRQPRYVDLDFFGISEKTLIIEPATEQELSFPRRFPATTWALGTGITSEAGISVLRTELSAKIYNDGSGTTQGIASTGSLFTSSAETATWIFEAGSHTDVSMGIYNDTSSTFINFVEIDVSTGAILTSSGSGNRTIFELLEEGPNGGKVWVVRLTGTGTAGHTRKNVYHPTGPGTVVGHSYLHYSGHEHNTWGSNPLAGPENTAQAADILTYSTIDSLTPFAGCYEYVAGERTLMNSGSHRTLLHIGDGHTTDPRFVILLVNDQNQIRVIYDDGITERVAFLNATLVEGDHVIITWALSSSGVLRAQIKVNAASIVSDTTATGAIASSWGGTLPLLRIGRSAQATGSERCRHYPQRLFFVKTADMVATTTHQEIFDELNTFELPEHASSIHQKLIGTGAVSDGQVIVSPVAPWVVWDGEAHNAGSKRFRIIDGQLYELDSETEATILVSSVPAAPIINQELEDPSNVDDITTNWISDFTTSTEVLSLISGGSAFRYIGDAVQSESRVRQTAGVFTGSSETATFIVEAGTATEAMFGIRNETADAWVYLISFNYSTGQASELTVGSGGVASIEPLYMVGPNGGKVWIVKLTVTNASIYYILGNTRGVWWYPRATTVATTTAIVHYIGLEEDSTGSNPLHLSELSPVVYPNNNLYRVQVLQNGKTLMRGYWDIPFDTTSEGVQWFNLINETYSPEYDDTPRYEDTALKTYATEGEMVGDVENVLPGTLVFVTSPPMYWGKKKKSFTEFAPQELFSYTAGANISALGGEYNGNGSERLYKNSSGIWQITTSLRDDHYIAGTRYTLLESGNVERCARNFQYGTNGTTGWTLAGTDLGAVTLTAVTDTTELTNAGLATIVGDNTVLRLVNGGAARAAAFSSVNVTSPATGSAFIRGGTGRIIIGQVGNDLSDSTSTFTSSASYVRRAYGQASVISNLRLYIVADAGQTIYFILPNLITGTLSGFTSMFSGDFSMLPTPIRNNTNGTITRQNEFLYFTPRINRLTDMSAYAKFIELGTLNAFGGILQINSNDGGALPPYYSLYGNTRYSCRHVNSTINRTSTIPITGAGGGAAVAGETIELRGTLLSDGAVSCGQTRNGSTASGANFSDTLFPDPFSSTPARLYIGSLGDAALGFAAFKSVKLFRHTRTMQELRDL